MSNSILLVSFSSLLITLILACYYFWQITFLPLRVILLLLIVQPIGAIFKIMHLPGGNEMLMAGFLASILFGLLIGYVNFKNKKNIYFYLIAVILVFQPILYFFALTNPTMLSSTLNYLLVGLIGTVKLRSMIIDNEINKVLTIFLVTGIVAIIIDTIDLLNSIL